MQHVCLVWQNVRVLAWCWAQLATLHCSPAHSLLPFSLAAHLLSICLVLRYMQDSNSAIRRGIRGNDLVERRVMQGQAWVNKYGAMT